MITILGSGFRSNNEAFCGMKRHCRFIYESDRVSYIFFKRYSYRSFPKHHFFVDGLASGLVEVNTSKPSVQLPNILNAVHPGENRYQPELKQKLLFAFCKSAARCLLIHLHLENMLILQDDKGHFLPGSREHSSCVVNIHTHFCALLV